MKKKEKKKKKLNINIIRGLAWIRALKIIKLIYTCIMGHSFHERL
jgi:hypothetical protein